MSNIIRVERIRIENFKNVEFGEVDFPAFSKGYFFDNKSDILGFYGQNGSGKTAFIEILELFKLITMGWRISNDFIDFITKKKKRMSFFIEFYVKDKEDEFLVFYEFEFIKKDKDLILSKEKISYKEKINKGERTWTNKRDIIDFNIDYEMIFLPKKNFNLLKISNKKAEFDLEVAKRLSQKERTSFIFNRETLRIFNNKKFEKFLKIINYVSEFSNRNLIVVKNFHSGLINLNQVFPLIFRITEKESLSLGNVGIPLSGTEVIPEEIFKLVEKIINQSNQVLGTIIPEMSIQLITLGKELTKDGRKGKRIELMSIRNDKKIPLKYESDGIKKIISILSALIAIYNDENIFLAIDELDSGIYEYLLGEILSIIEKRGKGQLVFTSHNLRPLELIDNRNIIFTTTNPKNRYVRFSGVKANNNLRNLYFRSINLGGQEEELYKETNSFEINKAFRVAGSDIINEK
jgi:AAA15 family ATPase/GTPase